MRYHTPVLLHSVLKFLDPKPDDLFIDATVGGGGHAYELLKHGAKVLAIDRDPEAIEHIKNQFQISNFKFQIGKDLVLVRSNFNNLKDIAIQYGFYQIGGILFDLGISSHQLEKAERGFSFQREGPLDMRMDQSLPIKAADIINNFDERRLNEIFKTFGQEKYSRSIARAICSARQVKPIETTTKLAQIIDEVFQNPGFQSGKWLVGKKAKVFQALRIVINSELLNLKEALPQTVELLTSGGRLVIISFHSLEDAIVKRFLKEESRLKVLTKKPIGPTQSEVNLNPQARSARLRAAERI